MLPVAGIAQAPAVFAVNSSVPARRSLSSSPTPRPIRAGSTWGRRRRQHWPSRGELFKMMAGINLIHVPYRGNAPALTDLMAGQIEVLLPSLGSSIEYVKTGKVVALATTGERRSDALPDLPTVAETLPGFEASSFYGIGAPRIARPRCRGSEQSGQRRACRSKLKARLSDLGSVPLPGRRPRSAS